MLLSFFRKKFALQRFIDYYVNIGNGHKIEINDQIFVGIFGVRVKFSENILCPINLVRRTLGL